MVPGGVSTIKIPFSGACQLISAKNCAIKPCFLGPLIMTASSFELSMNPMEIVYRFGVTVTGYKKPSTATTSAPTVHVIVGIEGPQTSKSNKATYLLQLSAK